jgi:hypothetical protein
MKKYDKNGLKEVESLAYEVNRKDWFDTVIQEIMNKEVIYSDPRIKGYIRETHEATLIAHIETYIKREESRKLALEYLSQIKIDGERKRIKFVEVHLKTLESILQKEVVSPKIKERLIKNEEEEVKTQVPEGLIAIYLEKLSWMKKEYLEQNE